MIWHRFNNAARRHVRDEDGASLIEYTIVLSLFMLLFFAVLDFGRLGFNWVMTEKAMQRAARIATTRPPVCTGVPEIATRADGTTAFGTLCRDGGVCTNQGVQQCVLSAAPIACGAPLGDLGGNPTDADIAAQNGLQTAQEIWCLLEPILPSNAEPDNIRLSYSFDPNLGFVGGPYVPMVEVGVVTAATAAAVNGDELRFEFITPLPGLAALAGGTITNIGANGIPFPDLSVSLPGEDLNRGDNG